MAKKAKKSKKSRNQSENQNFPISLPFNKISVIKSIHDKTLNFCFLSRTNNFIITCSASYLSLLDKNNFNVLSKSKMYDPMLFLIELSNNRILAANASLIYIFEVQNNNKLNLLYFYEEKNFEKMGIIGCSELNNENILLISPSSIKYYKQSKNKILELYDTFELEKIIEIHSSIKYYKQSKNKILELYDTFELEKIIEIHYEDYGTQFKSALILDKNNIILFTHQEIFIINYEKKNLVKKISVGETRVLLKYLKLENDYILIYHKTKLMLFRDKYLEIINYYLLNKEKEEITSIEKINKNKCIAYGTNLGKIYIFNYSLNEIIKEISFEGKIFNITFIKELEDNIIVNNLPKSEIGFFNYDSGQLLGKLNLKNSNNYRKGIYIKDSKKLLLGCANNFAILE